MGVLIEGGIFGGIQNNLKIRSRAPYFGRVVLRTKRNPTCFAVVLIFVTMMLRYTASVT